ncbi:MAG: hypothetical protein LBQ54_12010 [Planctomycetaceae bacterium]|jgi:hypothetical protein|nr:hypothetical protein [Planctomycetaceae bacterium]
MDIFRLVSVVICLGIGGIAVRGADSPEAEPTGKPVMPLDRITTDTMARMSPTGAIFRTIFGPEHDLNKNDQPDGWRRYQGAGYPQYLEMGIVHQRSLMGNQFYRIRIQRGSAAVFSPQLAVCRNMTYSAGVSVFANDLTHDKTFISLSLLDETGMILQTVFSEPVGNTNGWYQLVTPPLIASHSDSRGVVLGLHVTPFDDEQDVRGTVAFSQVQISEQPTVQFQPPGPWNTLDPSVSVVIDGTVSMVSPSGDPATISLFNPFGEELVSEKQTLIPQKKEVPHSLSPQKTGVPREDAPEAVHFAFHWEIPFQPSAGYYRLRVSVPATVPASGKISTDAFGETSFVILGPLPSDPAGMFGLSFPGKWSLAELKTLKPMIEKSGARQIKIPVWLPKDSKQTDIAEIIDFCTWLADRRIRPIGVLSHPPQEITTMVKQNDGAAGIFSLPFSVWYPSLERNLLNLGMIITDWQLGEDHDRSIQKSGIFDRFIGDFQQQLDQSGLDVTLGVPWDWMHPLPNELSQKQTGNRKNFVSLTNDFPLTWEDLEYYLDVVPISDFRCFPDMTPLPSDRYPLTERVTDLVLRMGTVRKQGAEAAFFSMPINNQSGLYQEDQTPTELFLPWRTTATLIGGKIPVPSIGMPKGSRNFCFSDPKGLGDVYMIWNNAPVQEMMNFGSRAKLMDVWGKEIPAPFTEFHQTVNAGQIPVFVTDAEPKITKIRQNTRLQNGILPEKYSVKHPDKITITNPFPVTVFGKIGIQPPEGILVEPEDFHFSILPGETHEENISLMLTPSAMSGSGMLEMNVFLEDWEEQHFSVYQEIQVGTNEITIEAVSRLNRRGQLEIYQTFTNNSADEVSFSCSMYAPDRPIQRIIISKQGTGHRENTYFIENGRELTGKPIRIVAREIRGERTLKCQIKGGE